MNWLLKDTPALFTDLYELTMAQVYFNTKINAAASFEITVRRLPPDWGFFVMAGLAELKSYLEVFCFSEEDINFLKSLRLFSSEFLMFVKTLKPDVQIRALPEGTVFFPNEPVLEVTGPLITAQLLETYVLNIMSFSVIEASLAARLAIAARGIPLMEFGLRRAQSPVAALRAARGAQIAGFASTSNLFASRLFNFKPSGTMAHSFVEIHDCEETAFENFIKCYGPNSILLIDTYDPAEGIKKAASVAKAVLEKDGTKILGIRIDSGDTAKLSKFARRHFAENGLDFLRIFVSGNMDEYRISELLHSGAEIDGFGVGTSFAVSHYVPDIDIVYKLAEYEGRKVFKTSPAKQTLGGRKTILRIKNGFFQKDIVTNFAPAADDLLKPFIMADDMNVIQTRLNSELAHLKDDVKKIQNPQKYIVELKMAAE
jgi:nicotinate phosphoribosyltransferase